MTKLIEAADQIKVMNEKLEVQQVAVKQKSEACETLLVDISEKTEQVQPITNKQTNKHTHTHKLSINKYNLLYTCEPVCVC